jgi:glycosyltransferase involved in cell wall biosynthesis
VACLSREDARYLEQRLGVARARIVAFPNGVDAGRFRAAPRTAVDAGRVLFVGGWLDVKGRRLVTAAWPSVLARVPGATLTLLGTGLEEERVLADFPPGVRPSVRVRPRVVDEAEVAAEFAAHGLFFMPSLTEGSPLALLEAMASGLPAVATAVGGIPDLLEDGRSGLLAPPLDARACADALASLLGDPGRAGQMGAAARARAEGLGWDRAAAAVERACRLARGEPGAVP